MALNFIADNGFTDSMAPCATSDNGPPHANMSSLRFLSGSKSTQQSNVRTTTGMCCAIVGVVVLVQLMLVSLAFPLAELLTDNPLFHIDGAFHWYEMKLAANLAATGNMVGFDPYFNAGHPDGVNYNWSAKFAALLAVLFSPGLSEIRLYKFYAFTSTVLAPTAFALAACVLRLNVVAVITASTLGILMWWLSYFHWYHTAGMVSFVANSYFSILYVALLIRFLRGAGGLPALVALGLMGALALFYHPLFPVPVAVAMLAFVGFCYDEIERKRLFLLFSVVPLISLLPNLVWLLPMHHYQQVFTVGVDNFSPFSKAVDAHLLWKEALGMKAFGSKIYPLALFASLWACVAASDPVVRKTCRIFFLVALLLEVLADIGAALPPIAFIQPNRFAPVGYLVLCIPAAVGVQTMMHVARTTSGRVRRWLSIGSFGLILIAGGILIVELVREVRPGDHGHYGASPPDVKPLGQDSRWIIEWLRNNTTRDGRILFETSQARVHDQAHMAGYYAYSADREFIGGPYPFWHFAGFWDGWLFGKPIEAISHMQLKEYFSLYNISAIIAHSHRSKSYLDSVPGIEVAENHGQFRAYKIAQPLTYFLKGRGTVEARGHNYLILNELRGPLVLLKYHYIPGMRSDPPALLQGVTLMDDPNQFVQIVNPPQRLRLYMP